MEFKTPYEQVRYDYEFRREVLVSHVMAHIQCGFINDHLIVDAAKDYASARNAYFDYTRKQYQPTNEDGEK